MICVSIPRSEFPNPQFERENWRPLNGTWLFDFDFSDSGVERSYYKNGEFPKTIVVPFCPESKLSGIEFIDFIPAVWYKKEIQISKNELEKNVFLHFGAVNYYSRIYVNNHFVCEHTGGFSHFKCDITPFVSEGKNEIVVYAKNDVRNPLQPMGKQSNRFESYGCSYTRSTGIWQSVWLEFVPENHIENFRFYPNIENQSVAVHVDVKGSGKLKCLVTYQGKEMAFAEKKCWGNTVVFDLPLAQKHLWEIGNGRLYDVTFDFESDEVKTYFGLREVKIDGKHFKLNGETVFQRTVLDQGYYPDGVYTAPTDEDLLFDIQISMSMGFNGARLHQKVFEPRYLYHADKEGYLVWGEYCDWGAKYENALTLVYTLPEWISIINRDFNHPSIIGWCPYNEVWNRIPYPTYEVIETTYRVTKQLDITRPCIDASGGLHCKVTDIYDIHDYDQNPETFKNRYDKLIAENKIENWICGFMPYKDEAVFVSEYGGIRWAEGSEGWGYGEAPKTKEEFLARYKGLTDALLDNDCIIGLCYTQLYDVEQEVNGLYTYDRKPKFDNNIIKKINERKAKSEL